MPTVPVNGYPLSAPTVDGPNITVDQMLNEPRRLNRFLFDYLDLESEEFLLDKFLTPLPGTVTGGSVIYQKLVLNALYSERDVQKVAPMGEFPVVTSARPTLDVAVVEKWGGKFPTSREARNRNNLRMFTIEAQQLANTIIRKANQIVLAAIEDLIDSMDGATTFEGQDWSNVILTGNSPTAPASQPIVDLLKPRLIAKQQQIPMRYDTLITSPMDEFNLNLAYGDQLEGILRRAGITTFVGSPQVDEGEAYFVAANAKAGSWGVEEPLTTETWYEETTQTYWTQSFVLPVVVPDNGWGVIKVTDIQGEA